MPITLKIKNPKASSPPNAISSASSPPPTKRAKIETDPVIPLHPAAAAPVIPAVPSSSSSPLPPPPPARIRSPTPPSHQVTHCLPIPTKKKSLPTTITSDDITQALDLLVLRYAKLAGYDAVQSGVLDVLRRWLVCYLLELGQMSEELALLGGRAWPNGRDLLEAIRFQGLFSRQENHDDEEEDPDNDKEPVAAPLDVSHLIAWRHTVPDYHDEYLNREKHSNPSSPSSSRATTPAWAQHRQVALVEPSGDQHQTVVDDEDTSPHTLLSSKKRIKEKIARSEIPAHLPDLPPLHTWKKTDAFPTNKMLAAQESQPALTNSTMHTWARLEARLTSSRRVQGSLRSLIGRLEGVDAMGGGTAEAAAGAGIAQHGTTPSVYTPSPRSGTVDLPPDVPQRSRRSTSRAGSAAAAGQADQGTPAASPTSSRPRSGRLSLRIRTRTQPGQQSVTTDAAPPLGSPLQSPPLATPTPGGEAAPSLSHRRSQSLRTLGGSSNGLDYFPSYFPAPSPSHSRNNSISSASFHQHQQQPWMNPLMSPATPRTASVMTPAWPFSPAGGNGYMDVDSPAGVGVMTGQQQQGPVVIPPAVNFKAAWYGRKP